MFKKISIKIKRYTGQSTIEYSVLVVILIGVFVAAGDYVKRGIQGRWKAAVDDIGDQYDPRTTTTDITYSLLSNADMRITAQNVTTGGIQTDRTDFSTTLEIKQGSTAVAPYP